MGYSLWWFLCCSYWWRGRSFRGLEAFPCPAFRVPKIFDFGATKISNGASFIETTFSQGETSRVEDERVVENGLSENLCIGCGLGLAKPILTLSQEPRMLFQNEHFVCLSLGATKSQFVSGMLGLLPCTGRWTWSVQCLKISFQGSPPGASPLIRSLVRSTSDYALGSMIPRPPLNKGSVRESHLTLAHVLEAFPPQMKFHTTPMIWLHILGLEFQQATRYHIEESNTWLVTRILPARKRLHLPQVIIFPFRASMSFSKLASMGSRKPILMPKYRTPCPSRMHLSPISCPHTHSFFSLLAHMAVNWLLPQFTFALEARQNNLRTAQALLRLLGEPLR